MKNEGTKAEGQKEGCCHHTGFLFALFRQFTSVVVFFIGLHNKINITL